jgi:hypothetical protein
MIILQWCNHRELAFSGQEYVDGQYSDALLDYERKKGQWDIIRIRLHNDENKDDWVIIHDAAWEDSC